MTAPAATVSAIGVLLLARFVVRHDTATWVAVFLFMAAFFAWSGSVEQPWLSPLRLFIGGAVWAAVFVLVLANRGLLAATAFMAVLTAIHNTPVTYDLTRWYAWRTGVVVVLVAALAYWGF